ncbi:MAG: ATP synthase F1 subunit delta [Mariniphaga sp.]
MDSAITVRYARAIFFLAKEKNQLNSLRNDADLISELSNNSPEFNWLLKNPVIRTSEKIRLMGIIFEGKTNELTQNFLTLVTRNKREVYIPTIFRNIQSLIRQEKNIKAVTITTAQPLDKEIFEKAEKILTSEFGTEVELTGRVNRNILGGMVLRVDDKQYDNSLITRLKKMKQELLKANL